ncbi:MAG: hypothetical protein ABIO02_03670, partial [Patescibacteria group bacterium]
TMKELAENIEFLQRTGMYRKVTNPLSVLRVQEGSPYLQLAKNKGILGEQTEDLVFYHAQFLDPNVQKVAELADKWVKDIYMLIFGLKGEVASVTLGPGGVLSESAQHVQQVLFGFRELEMQFINALTQRLLEDPNSDLTVTVNGFVNQRGELVKHTAHLVEQGGIGNPRLLEAIKDITS